MLLLWAEVPDDNEIFNIRNQEIHYIEGGVGHNEVGDNGEEWSDVDVVTTFWNDMPMHMLDDTCIEHKST